MDRSSSSSSLLHLKWLIVAIIFASLGLALTQPASPERSTDESFGSVLTLQKKISDDASNDPLDADSPLDALLASITLASASPRSSFSTPRYLTASYLTTFIRPSPRGPPHA